MIDLFNDLFVNEYSENDPIWRNLEEVEYAPALETISETSDSVKSDFQETGDHREVQEEYDPNSNFVGFVIFAHLITLL